MQHFDIEQYRAFLALNGLSDNTIKVYSAMAQRWCDWAITAGRDPYEPDPLAVRAWSKTVVGSRSSLAHCRAAISWWCRACEVDDVSAVVPLPRQPSNPQPLLDTKQTIALLRQAKVSGLAGLAVEVALYTAGRRSEVASLAWANVDFDLNTITLTRPKVRDTLRLPLHPNLADALTQRAGGGEQWVFPGRNGGHVGPAQVWTWVRTVAGDAGLGHVTPHMLRRTSLTKINDSTRDLRAAQLFAGHSRPETTARYTQVSQDRMRDAAAALAWPA